MRRRFVRRTPVSFVASVSATFVLCGGISRAGAQALQARQVTATTAASDLFSGTDAIGGIDDWYLSNGIVEAIIDHIGFQQDLHQQTGQFLPIRTYGFTGGSLVDLGLVGRNDDQFNWMSPVVNFDTRSPVVYLPASSALGDSTLPPVIARVDPAEGFASLTVYGFVEFTNVPALNHLLRVETEYGVRAGESSLHIRTTLTNDAPGPVNIFSIGDVVLLAQGGLLSFAAAPEQGFDISQDSETSVSVLPFISLVGRVSPEDGVVDTAAMVGAGEVSYTLFSRQERFVVGISGPFFFVAGSLPKTDLLASGASLSYERELAVGDRNDVASSADIAISELATAYQLPTGSVRGRLVAPDGMPFRASVELTLLDLKEAMPGNQTLLSLIGVDDRPQPLSQIRTHADALGEFRAIVPAGRFELRAAAEERGETLPMEIVVPPGTELDVGDIQLARLGRLSFRVRDAGQPGGPGIPAKITIKGINRPDPSFGVPIRVQVGQTTLLPQLKYSSPAANVTYTVSGEGELFINPGNYRVYASRGLEYGFNAANVTLTEGQTSEVELWIRRVVDTSGFVSADFHVHGAASADSSVPPVDRVANFAAAGVEVLVATDHNLVFDYQPIIEQLGLQAKMASIAGVEVTTGSKSPKDTAQFASQGHWNGWPFPVRPHERKNGAPEEAYVDPNVVFDRLRLEGAEVVQLNHPWWGSLGYFSRNGFDSALPLTSAANNFLLEESIMGSGTRNLDFDAIELYNGIGPILAYRTTRLSWFNLLSQGVRKVGTAVTDTHFVAIKHGGFPRTFVASDVTDMTLLDVTAFNDSLKQMKAMGTSGPYLEVIASDGGRSAGLGETLTVTGDVSLEVRVQAPCWIPVEEVRVYANGELSQRIAVDPRCTSVVRYEDILVERPTSDSFYVVEAGQHLPEDPNEPPKAPRNIMSVIEPGVVPLAFINPIFVDVDGNGVFDPPGVGSLLASGLEHHQKLMNAVTMAEGHGEPHLGDFHISAADLTRIRSLLGDGVEIRISDEIADDPSGHDGIR